MSDTGGNDRCQGTLGLKPWWMSEWQFDLCQCDLPAGHDGPHLCEHVRPDLEAAGKTLPPPLAHPGRNTTDATA